MLVRLRCWTCLLLLTKLACFLPVRVSTDSPWREAFSLRVMPFFPCWSIKVDWASSDALPYCFFGSEPKLTG